MVKLVSITPNAEQQILYCARVSSNQENESPKLLKYLIDHKHWSPFEMAHAVMEITTSRGIAAQILRHRSFSFQEFSQRYATPDSYELVKARRQAGKNRQSSVDDLSEDAIDWFYETQEKLWNYAITEYEKAVALGISRESARFLLPLSTTTKLYMAGSLRSWIHYIELRTQPDTQFEHRMIALVCRALLQHDLPHISEALGWMGN